MTISGLDHVFRKTDLHASLKDYWRKWIKVVEMAFTSDTACRVSE
jgi:hypothetical protein